ncbi:endonuclease/exonuclease/phosphatase family protein [Candidatus Albibeggiatoa sp. nov. NOAA]|uniref:endonuclease/exonuclease/phosphatase family protein n=1 Tax=Candidatus Albibeggiatoa sp. nov. NOAA TaxID=3162724 RepID=UPI0032F2F998|nr:endonuclease/exonuclease/phosphatase family protein [Thiotrichaceae bacterium]
MKLLKQVLRWSITLSTLVILLLGLAAEVVRDISVFWALCLYIPLLPFGLWAVAWDVSWRGKSLIVPYSLTVIGLIAASIHTYQSFHVHFPQPIPDNQHSIRLLHWNTLWGGKYSFSNQPHLNTWDGLQEKIVQQQPDIIVLSEPPQDNRLHQLAEQLGDDWSIISFEPAQTCNRCIVMFSVLSPYPMERERYSNPRNGNGFIIRIEMPQKTFRLLVVDGASKYDQLRSPFLQDTYQTVVEQHEKQEPIDVIAGDFNSIRRAQGFDNYPTMGDGYWLAGEKTIGWRGTWKSYLPLFDIDHVWVSQIYKPIYTTFLFDSASDHRGQLVEFYEQ